MKIIVFGGTGKIGAAVAWDLVREDSPSKRVGAAPASRVYAEATDARLRGGRSWASSAV